MHFNQGFNGAGKCSRSLDSPASGALLGGNLIANQAFWQSAILTLCHGVLITVVSTFLTLPPFIKLA
jgi:hypothetical protein